MDDWNQVRSRGSEEAKVRRSVTGGWLLEEPAGFCELTQSSSCMSWTIRCRTSSRVSLWAGAAVRLGDDLGGRVLSERYRDGLGAYLHRTLKFLPRATCFRDRLLSMASTRVTMSEPKPEGN